MATLQQHRSTNLTAISAQIKKGHRVAVRVQPKENKKGNRGHVQQPRYSAMRNITPLHHHHITTTTTSHHITQRTATSYSAMMSWTYSTARTPP